VEARRTWRSPARVEPPVPGRNTIDHGEMSNEKGAIPSRSSLRRFPSLRRYVEWSDFSCRMKFRTFLDTPIFAQPSSISFIEKRMLNRQRGAAD
jgi:hypothetical protein